jgi:hypothetical protein
MSKLNDWWMKRATKFLLEDDPFFKIGARRIYRNVQFELEPELFMDKQFDLETVSYTSHKMKSLEHHYLVQEDIEKAQVYLKGRMERRGYASTTIRHHGRPKKNTMSDFCMATTTIVFCPQHKATYFEINWRSMEWIKRGRADIVFFHQYIVPAFKFITEQYPIKSFSLYMHGITIHPMYFIMMCPHIDWKDTIEKLMVRDKPYANDCMTWTNRYLNTTKNHDFGIIGQVVKKIEEEMDPVMIKKIARYVRIYLRKELGK